MATNLQESDILGCYSGTKLLEGPESAETINTEIGFQFDEKSKCIVMNERSNVEPFQVLWHLKKSNLLVIENSAFEYLNRSYRISNITYEEVFGQRVINSFDLRSGKLTMNLTRRFNPDSTIQREYYDVLYIDKEIMNALLLKTDLDAVQVCSVYIQLLAPKYYNYPNPLEYYVVDYLFQNPSGNDSFRENLSFQSQMVKDIMYPKLYNEVLKKYGDSYKERSKIEMDFPFFKDWIKSEY
jgi:hypothetical protein